MRDVYEALDAVGLDWYLTGSEALAAYATPRQTLDTDVVVDAAPERLSAVPARLARDHYFAEPIRVGSRWMAWLVDAAGEGKVDLIVRDPDPWGREALARRQPWEHPVWGPVWVSSVEDLVLAKLEWSDGTSELQLRDCRLLIRMNGEVIDRSYLERWASELGIPALLERVMPPVVDAP